LGLLLVLGMSTACQVLREAREAFRGPTPTPVVSITRGWVRDALTGQPLPGVRLQAGASAILTDVGGAFSIASRSGESIVVSAQGYEPQGLEPTPAQAVFVDLVPDPSTTIETLYALEKAQQYAQEYALLHADSQALVTQEDFVRYMQQSRPHDLVDVTVGEAEMLASADVMGRVYEQVAKVPVEATVRKDGRLVQESWWDYAARSDGIWRWLRGPLVWPTPTATASAVPSATSVPTPAGATATASNTMSPFPPVPADPTPYQPILPGHDAVVVANELPAHSGPGEWYAIALILPRSSTVRILDWPRWVQGYPWYPVRLAGWTKEVWCNGAHLAAVAMPPEMTTTPVPAPSPVLPTVTPPGQAAGWIAFTSDRDGNREIYVVDSQGGVGNNLTRHPAQDASPSWGPGQARLVFSSDRQGGNDLFTINPDGNGLEQLTAGPADEVHPAWSPDGSLIAYVTNADGDWEIHVISSAGSGDVQITHNLAWDSWPAWSPSSRQLAYTSDRDGNYELYLFDLVSGTETRLTSNPASDAFPAWAPSGQEIAFSSAREGQLEIHSLRLDTTPFVVTRVTYSPGPEAENRYPSWSPDGQWLAFTSWRDGNAEVYLVHRLGIGLRNLTASPFTDETPAWRD